MSNGLLPGHVFTDFLRVLIKLMGKTMAESDPGCLPQMLHPDVELPR
jgi:hypothetical protein